MKVVAGVTVVVAVLDDRPFEISKNSIKTVFYHTSGHT